MPELPEVETIVRGLNESILNKSFNHIKIHTPVIFAPSSEIVYNKLLKSTITELFRQGKYIFIKTKRNEESCWLMIHLRMTGQLMLTNADSVIDKHTHIELFFPDYNQKLIYRDIRKFGRWQILENTPQEYLAIHKVAPDALTIDFAPFYTKISKRKGHIKALLLDQSLVAGIGNIYADEILFRSQIQPAAEGQNLSQKQYKIIYQNMQSVLAEAVLKGGTSFSDYVNSFGQKGQFQLELMVYQRDKQPCRKCGNLISKTKIAGRGTHFCPVCQQLY